MPDRKYPRNPFETWLKEKMGFTRGNPFATTIADQERPFLEEFFVPITGYDRIRGEETAVVFALPGGGKSALRVQLAAISLPCKAEADTLSVELTDFGWLVEQYRQNGRLTEQEFGTWILRETAVALFRLLFDSCVDSSLNQLSPIARVELAYFLQSHAQFLLAPRELYRFFTQEGAVLAYEDVITAVASKAVTTLLAENSKEQLVLLAEVADTAVLPVDSPQTVLAQFQELTNLLDLLNIHHLQYLIDRLDEMPTMANDPRAQTELLRPLLEYLPLLEMKGLSFKFFLSHELHERFIEQGIRQDRTLENAVHVRWEEESLQMLLNDRLLYFSDNLMSLQQCCADQQEAEKIEKELLFSASRSPRRMLQAASALFETAYEVGGGRLIHLSDWQQARRKPLDAAVPTLKIDLEGSKVTTAIGVQKITKTEKKILKQLIENDGYCDREELIMDVWENGVTDQGVDQAISRLRRKLGDDGQHALYLLTVWGQGFRLQFYESVVISESE